MNIDGNATISPPQVTETRDQAVTAAVPPIESQEVAVQTQPLELLDETQWRLWAPHSEWFKANIGKIKPEPDADDNIDFFINDMENLGFASSDINNILWGKKTGHNKQLEECFRLFKQRVAIDRFAVMVDNCVKRKTFFGKTEPCNQPMTSFAKEEPCNSPNLQGCLCSPW